MSEKRLCELRARLSPSGARLADVPFDHRGLSLAEWRELQRLEALASLPPPDAPPPIDSQPVATARARYGWRSLPPGTHFLGDADVEQNGNDPAR